MDINDMDSNYQQKRIEELEQQVKELKYFIEYYLKEMKREYKLRFDV